MKVARRSILAFTLVELLVVVGLIAVLASVIGLGLGRGSDAHALKTARGLLIGQLHAVRAQAALNRDGAALAVVADPTLPDENLRTVAVAIRDGGLWRASADGVRLPDGVLIVPPDAASAAGVASSLLRRREPVVLGAAANSAAISCWLVAFRPDGSVAESGGGELWVVVGQSTAAEPNLAFSPEAPVRGVTLSRYGAISDLDRTEDGR